MEPVDEADMADEIEGADDADMLEEQQLQEQLGVEPPAQLDRQLISQGAEARIYVTGYCGRMAVVKERFKKTYRLPELDQKLTVKRMKQEVRSYAKARIAGVSVPTLYLSDLVNGRLYMEYIDGGTVKDWLRENRADDEAEALRLAYAMGESVAKLHDKKIVHGDLTTSNFMLRAHGRALVMIDFGLANTKADMEEKAVDLYLMEKAMHSSHNDAAPLVSEFLRAYKAKSSKSDAILHRLHGVRQRGRKRDMVG
jgi:TP53 regulating kinase and related kinases